MFLSKQDVLTASISIIVIGVLLLLIEILIKRKWLSKLAGRKLLHFTAITTCAFVIQQFENRKVLAVFFGFFFFILLWVIRRGWMQVNQEKTYGIALFPLAFSLLLFIPVFDKHTIVLSALILAVSDALAGVGGEYFANQKIIFLTEKKSWAGFGMFYGSAFVVTLIFTGNYSWAGLLFASAFALLPALTELFSYRGSDNFTVPIFTAVWALLFSSATTSSFLQFWLLIILLIATGFVAVQKKWLTISGTTAAIWMALLLYATGTLSAFLAPGIFLITGSLLSKLNKEEKEKKGRNAKQVFANGVTGVLFMVIYKITTNEVYLVTALASFCISMADTVSSELGIYFKGSTFNILSFKKMQRGLSGGVSFMGTAAGVAGAAFLAVVLGYFYKLTFTTQAIIFFTGFAGMMMDSILGTALQVKYKTPKNLITEQRSASTTVVAGFEWCTNDVVNVLSNLVVSVACLFLQLFSYSFYL